MIHPLRSSAGETLTDVVLVLFRVNNLLLTGGDRLVAGLHLTSARWQILGAIDASPAPQPVAWLARDLGANRQNVQRIVNDLAIAGLVTFEVNPRHRRAQLVVLTAAGRKACNEALRLHAPWVNDLAEGLSDEDLAATQRVMHALRQRLAAASNDGGASEPATGRT